MPKQIRKITTKDNAELIDLLTDLALFTRKWTTPRLAKLDGKSKQGLEYHVQKKVTGGAK